MAVFKLAFLVLRLMCCLHSIKAMGLCEFADKFPCEDNEGSVCFKSSGCKGRNPRQGQTIQHTTQQKQVTTETRPLCPPDMVYANCSTCQRTCSYPKGCITNCTEPETCICASGFLLKGGDCVPEEECGCFIEGEGVIHEGGFYVNSDCTIRADCLNGQLFWDTMYTCSANEVCEERDNIRQCDTYYVDCLDVYNGGFTTSGVYTINPANWTGSPFQVYCNMTDGGGWTTFQRRVDGTVDFYQNWTTYKEGFGYLDHEHWLGNEKLYYLTNQKRYTIRIDLVNWNDSPYYAKFDFFRINDANDNYTLSQLGSHSGTTGYAASTVISCRRNYQFSTYDHGNTRLAVQRHGAWWYAECGLSNLNGKYRNKGSKCWHDVIHVSYLPVINCIQYVEMKLRPF